MTRHESLFAQLKAHAPFDRVEAGHRAAMVNLLTNAADPFSRGHFAPGHFTASLYIVDDGGRLLLHHHRRLNRWLQMGGHVEAGELPALAALREGREESGLADLELVGDLFDLDIHPIPAGKGEPDHHHFDVRYLARTRTPEAIVLDEAESKELAWLPLDRAEELMHAPESSRVIRKIERMLTRRSWS
ncbi:MAG TPA: NUDIX domain-containing protein [Thermoanaerobaculia bacterium]